MLRNSHISSLKPLSIASNKNPRFFFNHGYENRKESPEEDSQYNCRHPHTATSVSALLLPLLEAFSSDFDFIFERDLWPVGSVKECLFCPLHECTNIINMKGNVVVFLVACNIFTGGQMRRRKPWVELLHENITHSQQSCLKVKI